VLTWVITFSRESRRERAFTAPESLPGGRSPYSAGDDRR